MLFNSRVSFGEG